MRTSEYPIAREPDLVGKYPALVKAGGGYVWDAVLEYRVWFHPHEGARDIEQGGDYYYAFATYEEALVFAHGKLGSEEPIALVLQEEYIDEPDDGVFVHVKEQRMTEWPVELLQRPQRGPNTIPDFLSPDAPSNRLDALRFGAKPTPK